MRFPCARVVLLRRVRMGKLGGSGRPYMVGHLPSGLSDHCLQITTIIGAYQYVLLESSSCDDLSESQSFLEPAVDDGERLRISVMTDMLMNFGFAMYRTLGR